MPDEYILIVDDDADIRNLLGIYLKNEGYLFIKCASAEEALEILAHHNISLILLDVMLPDINGIQACLKIRETKKMPIIFISAKVEDLDIVEGLMAGGDDYVTKPFHPVQLMSRIKAQLRRYRQYNENQQEDSVLEYDGLLLNPISREVWVCGDVKQYLTINLVGGIIIGLIGAWLILMEGRILTNYLFTNTPTYTPLLSILFFLMAATVFIFILKFFLSRKTNRLMVYTFLSVIIALGVVYLLLMAVCALLFYWIEPDHIQTFFNSEFASSGMGIFLQSNGLILFLLCLVLLFFFVFSWLIRNKVKYILHITNEVKDMEKQGFGKTIKVVGRDELADLAGSINHMSLELHKKILLEKEIENQKNQLITNVSHDLRSPLTSVMGYVDLLKKGDYTSPTEYTEYLSIIDRRLHGLNTLINELFELTKLREMDNALKKAPGDLTALLRHIDLENSVLLRQKGFSLLSDFQSDTLTMELDSERFARAIQNLFDNVIKYGRPDTEVHFAA